MSQSSPRVSVGLPVYNGEQYLGEAIEGILNQTFRDLELVISDNGSTDGTEAICRDYAARDQRIRYHRHEVNRGGSWNYNTVFALASSAEYYMWHAHDDKCAPDLIQRCVDVLDRHPEVILCHADTVIINERSEPIATYVEDLNLSSLSPSRRYKQYHDHDRDCPLCSIYFALMRRGVVQETPLMLPHVNSESNLISELALRGPFHKIPEPLFYRRDHEGISTRKYTTHAERIAWYDPSRMGKGGHPGWDQLYHQFRSVTRVPMSPVEKAACYLQAGRYFLWLAQGSLRTVSDDIRRRFIQSRRHA